MLDDDAADDATGLQALGEATGMDFSEEIDSEMKELEEIDALIEKNRKALQPEHISELGLDGKH